jgi:hypothetical protein
MASEPVMGTIVANSIARNFVDRCLIQNAQLMQHVSCG